MRLYLPANLRRQLEEADDHRCAYCHTSQMTSGYPMVVDLVVPRSRGGVTAFDNLCFACHRCNLYKRALIELHDPLTGVLSPLFHPRQHLWLEHFAWDETGFHLRGLTAVGRVTVIALKMNNDVIVSARRNWVGVGWHPLTE